MSSLVQSVNIFPYNWSVWLKLTDLLDGEEEVSIAVRLSASSMLRSFPFTIASRRALRIAEELYDQVLSYQFHARGSPRARGPSYKHR